MPPRNFDDVYTTLKPKTYLDAKEHIKKVYPEVEKHLSIGKYQTNDFDAFLTILRTIVFIVVIYSSYFYLPTFLLPLWAFVRGCLFIRIYILFHDCTHMSFFTKPSWNRIFGIICSCYSVTPFQYWRDNHNNHHSIIGNKDKEDGSRTILFSKTEYSEMPIHHKIFWRIVRDPFIFFNLISVYQFVFQYRYLKNIKKKNHKNKRFTFKFSDTLFNSSLFIILLLFRSQFCFMGLFRSMYWCSIGLFVIPLATRSKLSILGS
jgi:fatty acid desaturase